MPSLLKVVKQIRTSGCLFVCNSYVYSVRRAKDEASATSPATPSSLPNIPSSAPDKLDDSTCPSQCIPVNSSLGSAGTKNSLLRHNNINSMSSSSHSRAVPAAWRHSKRDPFTGFCRCRDLGLLRVCQRCPQWKTSSPTV